MSETKNEAKVQIDNIYKRIQKVRNHLAGSSLKKTGKNQGRDYFELGDFLPSVTKFSEQEGVMPLFTLQDKRALLRVFNTDNPQDVITFYIPIAEAKVPGAQPVQNLGAQITYLERYLYMIAFEIAENDAVDASKTEEIDEIDQIAIDKIDAVKTLPDLAKISQTLQKQLGPKFRKSLIQHYTRRKTEIESESKKDETA